MYISFLKILTKQLIGQAEIALVKMLEFEYH